MERIYLDYNANAPLNESVRERLSELLTTGPVNPGSIHWHGQRAKGILEGARRTLLRLIDGSQGSLTFTGSATEANNTVLGGIQRAGDIVLSPLEHPSMVEVARFHGDKGREIRWISHDETGRIDPGQVEAVISESTALVSVMAANNELGNLNPIGEVAEICRAAEVPLHVDASQVIGRVPFSIVNGISAVTLSAHKAGGPVGIGALWLRAGYGIEPLIRGGHQERGRRAGTEDVLYAAAFARMLETADFDAWAALARVRDAFEAAMARRFDVVVNGDTNRRLPNTSNISLLGRESEELVMALDLAGISVSAGSACTAGALDDSPVLLALGVPKPRVKSAIRVSFGPEHADLDVAELVGRFAAALG